MKIALKGKEVALPAGKSFVDPDGHVRREIRARWYMPGHTYESYALYASPISCPEPHLESAVNNAAPYPATAKPVFFGHYWLKAERPEILAENVACFDYSVAKVGFLCGYRWQGEQTLRNESFVWVGAK